MDMWGAYFDHALVFFNLLILSYFVLGKRVSQNSKWFSCK